MSKKPKVPSPDQPLEGSANLRFFEAPMPSAESIISDQPVEPYVFSAADEKAALRMLGLDRKYKNFSPDERGKYLITPERMRSFDAISTTTNPRKAKTEQKKGIVSEILFNDLISKNILKDYPTLYLGAGTDVEYPLALGSREIIMLDYILDDKDVVENLIKSISDAIGQDPEMNGDEIRFPFDFGEGKEEVVVKLIAKNYSPEQQTPDAFISPEKIGMILTFAPQGPMGVIVTGDDLKSKVVSGGAILEDGYLTTFDSQTHEQERKLLGEKILD
jgi:hypothetical protein